MAVDWLVSSDMDGTLLNHHDYRWDSAKPCLDYLEEHGIPVILNTSKTYAEVTDWVAELNIAHPFIVENGSAIYCPQDYFPTSVLELLDQKISATENHLCIRLGAPIEQLIAFKQEFAPELESLVECSLERAIEITGLSETEANASQERAFTLPLFTTESDTVRSLASRALEYDLQILQGGRFAHLMGLCDKGSAVKLLSELYQKQYTVQPKLIALGDSGNDVAMLNQADYPIIIQNHKGGWQEIDERDAYKTQQQAPEGWVEGIVHILANDYKTIRNLHNGR